MADNIVPFPLTELARHRQKTRNPERKIPDERMREAHELLDEIERPPPTPDADDRA